METIFADVLKVYGKEKAVLVRDVTSVATAKIKARNLFGWRHYIDKVVTDIVAYMIATEFKYSGGAYVACAMQSALDNSRYCSAKKRRGDYESASLEDMFQVMDDKPSKTHEAEAVDMIIDISLRFGKDFADKLAPFIRGEESQLDKEVLKKLKSPEFLKWFKAYREV